MVGTGIMLLCEKLEAFYRGEGNVMKSMGMFLFWMLFLLLSVLIAPFAILAGRLTGRDWDADAGR